MRVSEMWLMYGRLDDNMADATGCIILLFRHHSNAFFFVRIVRCYFCAVVE